MKDNRILNNKTLQEIVETSVDAIIVIDKFGIIQYVNAATILMFYYQKEELIGQNVKLLMPSPDREKHDGYLNNYHRTKQKKIIGIGREVKARKKNGVEFSCSLAISEVLVEGEQLFIGVIHDISALKEAQEDLVELNKSLETKVSERTEKLSEVVNRLLATNEELTQEVQLRKKAEAALKKSEEELRKSLDKEKELSDLKSRFVTMASHEFRTPLSTVLSSTNLIRKYAEMGATEKINVHTHKIGNTVQHLTGILNDFLSLGRWEEGKVHLEFRTASWTNFIQELRADMEAVLKEGQLINLELVEIEFFTDWNILKNAMINLISNASKYSAEGKTIGISNSIIGDKIRIEVRDQGIGIP
ncbi:MAG: PAS domain-containing sensor histidine kinase, partial [Bacteroidetes bacterium]|nr:PAS domain-containing sensor histidine kinase [Bacteroidota bacterium]